MDSRKISISLSNLPNCLLVLIISFLPLKESVRTSVITKQWKNLYRETTNLVFKESDFLNLSNVFDEETIQYKRNLFVSVVRQCISRFTDKSIESFELYLSQPKGFEADIISFVEFAASRQANNLVLDFSKHASRETNLMEHLQTLFYYQEHKLDVSRIVFNLLNVKNLTICSLILQMIQECDDPMELHDPMKTQHLVMKTNMHTNEFIGITIFLNSCPELKSLTFDMLTTELIVRVSQPLDPEMYWLTNNTNKCLEKTLKVVKVKNFRGGSNELHVFKYLVRNGCVMDRVEIYEAVGLNHKQHRLVLAAREEIQKYPKKASKHLKIILYKS
ncbi:unnamed protein product [Cochlearia groenlandica]